MITDTHKNTGLQESYHMPLRDGCAEQSEEGVKGGTKKGHPGGGTTSTVHVQPYSECTNH
jgi:hypothetical protein